MTEFLYKRGKNTINAKKTIEGMILGEEVLFPSSFWSNIRAVKYISPVRYKAEKLDSGQIRVTRLCRNIEKEYGDMVKGIKEGDCLDFHISMKEKLRKVCDSRYELISSPESRTVRVWRIG